MALTATWHRDLWTYRRALLGLGQLLREPRFEPLESGRGTLEIGDSDVATIVRSDGITVLLEADVRPELLPHPSALLEEHTELRAKLVLRPGRSWIALTVPRTADRHRDSELELLLANAVRRLVKRLRRRQVRAVPLSTGELTDALDQLTPGHAHEEWNGLRLGTERYRVYAVPPHLARSQPGVVTVTLSSDLDDALVLAPAGAPSGPGSLPLTGRQRSAFIAALP